MTIEEQLRRDEGEILSVYLDSRGIRTAGVGHNLEAHGIDWPVGTPITQEQSDQWLDEDITIATSNIITHLPWVMAMDEARQGVFINMMFNMGVAGLLGFHRTLAMAEAGNYDGAADAMLESKWATEVGARATRLSIQLKTGIWQ